ncbi:MAG: NAD-dependent epimerase/dehydratase family protein [Myxococcota bacterium]
MIRQRAVLVTGANGEMGHGLISRLAKRKDCRVVALDLRPLEPSLQALCETHIVGDILDRRMLERLVSEFEVHTVFHLAALLSSRSEFSPETAHDVNVEGTLNLLGMAALQAKSHGERVKFLFPSSIAAYGLPDLAAKNAHPRVGEHEFNQPTTMYGCNKLYCEHLGRYYDRHYRQLAVEAERGIDFRSIRFPGLISAFTVPHGGTSDYAPEMIHAAAQRQPYRCFVREDTRISFMAMPDAIDALIRLMDADRSQLTSHVYNITAFAPSALEFAELTRNAFESVDISFEPDPQRQAIVDSWPADLDDARARKDWDFAPRYDLACTFSEYLVPHIRALYRP